MSYHIQIITNAADMPDCKPQSLFNTPAWMRLYDNVPQARAFAVCAFDNHFQLSGLQCFVLMRYYPALPACLGTLCLAMAAPQFWISPSEQTECYAAMLQIVYRYCKGRAVRIEVRHIAEQSPLRHAFEQHAFNILPWYNIQNTLNKSHDNVTCGITRNRQRQWQRARDAHVQIITGGTMAQRSVFYDILHQLYHRIHRPCPHTALFEHIASNQHGEILLALYHDNVIGGAVCLHYGETSYLYYIATLHKDARYRAYHPSTALICEILQRAAQRGETCFDFLVAGSQQSTYGVRNFKLDFGGTLVKEMRCRKLVWPF